MSKEKFYVIVIFALVLINLGTLAYVLESRDNNGHPRRNPVDDVIVNRLQLNDEQQGQFEELKHEHHSQMVDIQKRSSELHSALFALLKEEDVNPAGKDSLLQLIQQGNMQKEIVTYGHFKKLRAILRPEQKEEFDEFVEDISRHIMGPHRRPE